MRVTRIAGTCETQKKRVAAYCRVSTLKDEQEESFETQERYYRTFIQRNSDWIFAGVYGDPGCSAVTAERRPQFQKMMADASAGRIDLILCKSISRFSRNVVDCRRCTDRLKERNVYVRFEKENVTTSDPTAEFVFNLLSAVAQGESRSLSENIRWAHQERIKRGEYNLGSNRVLGYDTIDGKLVPNGDGEVVREIFTRFLAGEAFTAIAEHLNAVGFTTLRGGAFYGKGIKNILKNEIYAGDRLLQKDAPKDLFTKRPDRSKAWESYSFRNTHEAIIDRKTWDAVQEKLKAMDAEREKGIYKLGKEHHILYGRAFCGGCGAPLVRRTFRKGRGDERYKAWQCKGHCGLRSVSEEKLLGEIARAGVELDDVEKVQVFTDRLRVETKK